jgi:hypothetical protein
MEVLMLRKLTAIIIIMLFAIELLPSKRDLVYKIRYQGGSINIIKGAKGIFKIEEESLNFTFKGIELKIPLERIKLILFSKKEKSADYIRSILPTIKSSNDRIHYRKYTNYHTFETKGEWMIVVTIILAITSVIYLLTRNSKNFMYFSIVYEEGGNERQTVFKIKKRHFNSVYPELFSKKLNIVEEL